MGEKIKNGFLLVGKCLRVALLGFSELIFGELRDLSTLNITRFESCSGYKASLHCLERVLVF